MMAKRKPNPGIDFAFLSSLILLCCVRGNFKSELFATGFANTGNLLLEQTNTGVFVPSCTRTGRILSFRNINNNVLQLYASNTNNDDNANDDNNETESERLKKQADKLREEIRAMEEKLQKDGESSRRVYNNDREDPEIIIARNKEKVAAAAASLVGKSKYSSPLADKKVLVVGANGRLGSMVCRYLLRNHPQTEVVAAVHYVGEASTRGYGRLSYEVGAEDGIGTINPAWDLDDRNARFEYTDEMADYNLQNLRVVEVELLDPIQTQTICEDIDCILWCATDFNGNKPRSISGPFNAALLFRAVVDPTKGRVEIEGLRNILNGLKQNISNKRWNFQQQATTAVGSSSTGMSSPFSSSSSPSTVSSSSNSKSSNNEPTSFVLVSASDTSYQDFETPLGSFYGLKRDGERILCEEYPTLGPSSYTILRMSRYEDNFVEEGLDIEIEEKTNNVVEDVSEEEKEKTRRRINRRDAAKATVDALINPSLKGKIVDVWTAVR